MIDTQSLMRKTSLRKATKGLSFGELDKVARNLAELIAEREEEESRIREDETKKQEKVAQVRKQMTAAGITEEELMAALGGSASTKKTIPPKYEITGEEGNTHQWTGRGRTPKAFKAYFEQGGSKEDCLIKQ